MTAAAVYATMPPNASQESAAVPSSSSLSSSPTALSKPLDVVYNPDSTRAVADAKAMTGSAKQNSDSAAPDAKDAASNTTPPNRNNCMPPSGPAGLVTFSKRVRVKKVRSYRNYTQAEMDATWHTPEDYQDIKTLCIRTLKLMHAAGDAFRDCNEWSSRGLEVRAKKAAQQRKENRAFATNAVLDEQDHQEAVNGSAKDVERIRQVYREISVPSQQVAHDMALRDYEDIQTYIQDDKEVDWDRYVREYKQKRHQSLQKQQQQEQQSAKSSGRQPPTRTKSKSKSR